MRDPLDDYRALNDPVTRRQVERRGDFFVVEGVLGVEALLGSPYPVRSVLATERRAERVSALVAGRAPLIVRPEAEVAAVAGFDVHRGVLASADRLPLPPASALVDVADLAARRRGHRRPRERGRPVPQRRRLRRGRGAPRPDHRRSALPAQRARVVGARPARAVDPPRPRGPMPCGRWSGRGSPCWRSPRRPTPSRSPTSPRRSDRSAGGPRRPRRTRADPAGARGRGRGPGTHRGGDGRRHPAGPDPHGARCRLAQRRHRGGGRAARPDGITVLLSGAPPPVASAAEQGPPHQIPTLGCGGRRTRSASTFGPWPTQQGRRSGSPS